MATTASAPPWNAEDDLILKNSVEAGASLEALAKGAVKFSRKFTVKELKDRWHSLLYDADISAAASECMTRFELSNPHISFKPSKPGISKARVGVKRKVESIRRQYYEMRKKLCSFDTYDLNFIHEPAANDANMNMNNELLEGDYMVGEHVENYFEYAEEGQNDVASANDLIVDNPEKDHCIASKSLMGNDGEHNMLQDLPLWKTMEDVSAPEMLVDADLDANINQSQMELGEEIADEGINKSVSVGGEYFTDISDSLLNFANDNESLVVDVEGDNGNEKSCFVVDKSLPLTSPKGQPDTSDSNPVHVISEDVNKADKSEPVNLLHPSESTHMSEINGFSIESAPNSQIPELQCEMIECILNTEDPDIPCNDDVFPDEFSESRDTIPSVVSKPDRSINLKKEENSAPSCTNSQMLGHQTIPKVISNVPVIGCSVKTDPSDANRLARIPKLADLVATPKFSTSNMQKQEGIKTHVTFRTENSLPLREPVAASADTLEAEANPSTLYQDESEEEELDGDRDIPYFSDIENMILEMDLSPDEEESRFSRKVARYQNDDTKRKIVRLEQCARSFTQRAIASKGALAVFYGRHLKRYIKKTEVMLGRATEDNEVDIDLGEEGRANKISRRQALIKMEGNGSFFLKNVGKTSIFLNGKEILSGHRVPLSSSCLIEITGMSFVFEMNQKSIERYLENERKKGKRKYTKLEWSPPSQKNK